MVSPSCMIRPSSKKYPIEDFEPNPLESDEALEGEPVDVELLTLEVVGPVSSAIRANHRGERKLSALADPGDPDPDEVAILAAEELIVELARGEDLGRALEVAAQALHRGGIEAAGVKVRDVALDMPLLPRVRHDPPAHDALRDECLWHP